MKKCRAHVEKCCNLFQEFLIRQKLENAAL